MSEATGDGVPPVNSPEAIERGLAGKTVAIVGLSGEPESASYLVGSYLQEHGYRVVPVNPRAERILGQKSYASLREVPERVDVVDVFRRADAVPGIAAEAVAIGAKVLWMQLGIVSREGAKIAREAGLAVVMNRCMKQEHKARMKDEG